MSLTFASIGQSKGQGTRGYLLVLVWPLLALALIGALWLYTASEIEKAKASTELHVRERAVTAARSYAQQLSHMIEQIDQITLRLEYRWKDQHRPINLEADRKNGFFPENGLLYAEIFDSAGALAASTMPDPVQRSAGANLYFQLHRERCCLGLTVLPPAPSLMHGRPVMQFTRRLNRADGSFDGVAVVSVEPRYFVTFQEGDAQGSKDFVSLRFMSGPLIASKVNGMTGNSFPIFYRADPVYTTGSGYAVEGAELFRDGEARHVAWQRLEKYPLVAVAGLSTSAAFAPFHKQAKARRDSAVLGSLLLLGLSCVAATLAARSVRRRTQVEETQETYRLATDAANEGFCMFRPIRDATGAVSDFRLEDCNNRAADLVGSTREALIGVRVSSLEPKTFADELLRVCRIGMQKGFAEEEVRVPEHSPVRAHWIFRRIVRSRSGLALTVRDISEEKEQKQALAHLANNDTLTRLPNRHWLNTFLPSEISRAAAQDRRLAVLFIDLDNFKNVNDTLGHEAGDELLVKAAERLRGAVRASDHVARLGGDEFVVILEQVETDECVAKVAKAIIAGISCPFQLEAGTGNDINASIGISLYPEDGADAEHLLKHADIAMYAAKAAGKGRYAFYHPHLSETLVLRLDKERALRSAVENDDFIVHYQPRVGLHSGELTSMEALVRWNRPGQGMVYPSHFIDIAEDIGLIVRLGELVIEKVCDQLAGWKAEGLVPVPVSVNVSPQQLKSGTLSAFIRSSLERHGIDARLLEIELTESAVIDRSVVISNELAALRAQGIKLMIDDFGTGYSSMAQLHRLDVDVLKVDRAFTRALSESEEGHLLFGAIVSMANALDMCVVAEGVETGEQLDALQALECDEVQGNIVSQAVSAGETATLLLKRFLLPRPHQLGQPLPA